jgi:hypothetical protein
MSMREIDVTLRYDSDANAASLRLASGPGGRVGGNVFVTPPGKNPHPEDSSSKLRMRFDDEGRLYAIEFLMPDEQLPPEVMERLRGSSSTT